MDLSFQLHALPPSPDTNRNLISPTTSVITVGIFVNARDHRKLCSSFWNQICGDKCKDAWRHSHVFFEISDCQGQTWWQWGQTCHIYVIIDSVCEIISLWHDPPLSHCTLIFRAVAYFMFCTTTITLLCYWRIIIIPDEGFSVRGLLIYS
jgi:hypothetical protein